MSIASFFAKQAEAAAAAAAGTSGAKDEETVGQSSGGEGTRSMGPEEQDMQAMDTEPTAGQDGAAAGAEDGAGSRPQELDSTNPGDESLKRKPEAAEPAAAPEAKRRKVLSDSNSDSDGDNDGGDENKPEAEVEAEAEAEAEAATSSATSSGAPMMGGFFFKIEDKSKTQKEEAEPEPEVELEEVAREQISVFTEEHPEPKGEAAPTATALAERIVGSKYDPIKDAGWKRGQPVPYLAVAETFAKIEATTKRLEIVDHLSQLLRSVIALTPEDLLPVVYLCTNQVAPSFAGIELGIGETIIMKAICEATGRTLKWLKSEYAEAGDLGIVAQESRGMQQTMMRPKPLTVRKVFGSLKAIALEKGQSSMHRKKNHIKALMVAGRGAEPRYLVRSCQGKLRIGLAEASVLAALAVAAFMTRPAMGDTPVMHNTFRQTKPKMSMVQVQAELDESIRIVKEVFCELPWMEKVLDALLEHGLKVLHDHCYLRPGIPVKPMLAHPTKGVTEVLDRFGGSAFTCEYKYDGERAQVHCREDGTIAIYSRSSEDNTTKYPDLISMLPTVLTNPSETTSYVLDCEAVAFDRTTKAILPFQVLSTRKRKDVAESDIQVQVCLFAFDLLYLNGEPMLKRPFQERRERLRATFTAREGYFMFAHSMDSNDVEDIQIFLDESVKGNCEGLMVKTLTTNATYEPSRRSYKWLKVKKDYIQGVGDTLDLVPIGAYTGKGKRTGVFGGFLLACYDPDTEVFQSICKIGTGFSDEDLSSLHASLSEHIIPAPRSYYAFPDTLTPDYWFAPVQVWEVGVADLSISPVHKAAIGLVDPDKGISLRFPRYLRLRDDKTPETSTSASQVATLYRSQDINHGYGDAGGGGGGDDDDFFNDELL